MKAPICLAILPIAFVFFAVNVWAHQPVRKMEVLAFGDDSSFATALASPQTPSPAPFVVHLHGLCNDPVVTCSWFAPGQLSGFWQVCPQASAPCGGSGFQWAGGMMTYRRQIEGALRRAKEQHPGAIKEGSSVLVGYSQGAFVAVAALSVLPQRFGGLVLVSASARPQPSTLRRAGVERIALLAGDWGPGAQQDGIDGCCAHGRWV